MRVCGRVTDIYKYMKLSLREYRIQAIFEALWTTDDEFQRLKKRWRHADRVRGDSKFWSYTIRYSEELLWVCMHLSWLLSLCRCIWLFVYHKSTTVQQAFGQA